MKLDEIFESWEQDCKTNPNELGTASLDIAKMHHKYLRMLSKERLLFKKQEQTFLRLFAQKRDWMMGELSQEELKELGWPQWLKATPLRSQVDDFVRTDKQIIEETLKLALQKEKIEVLDSIMKLIANRSFQINAAINWAKFQAGY